jgi:hypothetical protein
MPRYEFERESRTPYSEALLITADGTEMGRVDLHYGLDIVNATLCVPDTFSEDDIHDLIGEIDERLVLNAEPYREDFVVTVWLGRQAGVYSEEFEDEETEDEFEGNGHKE